MKTNYQIKKIGEVCEIVKDPPAIYSGEKDYYSTGAVNNDFLELPEKIEYKNRPSRANIYPKLGDVGFAKMRFTNKTLLINDKLEGSIFSTGFCFLRPVEILDSRYLFYFIVSDEFQKVKDANAGVGIMGGINNSEIKNINIPFVPLSEQKRIVKILDETFKKLEKVKENTEKNLQNSKRIFESYLQNVFLNSGKDWRQNTFGEIIETLTDYHANGSYEVLKANVELKRTEDCAWMVRSTDFENNFENNKRYISEKAYNFLSKSKIFGNEIIMSKIGNAGKVYLMPKINRPCSLAMNLFLIRLKEKECSSEYVYRYLNSKNGQKQISLRILGTATKTITKDNVRSILIPVPSLNEQKVIVKKLNQLSGQIKKLESIYQKKLESIEELKKSVLKQALEGKFVVQKQTTSLPVPSPYIRNQVHAAIVGQVSKDGGETTEVAVAKYDHLLQEIFDVSLGYQFQTHLFGPFDATIKKLVSSGLSPRNKWFTKRSGMIIAGSNITALLSHSSNLYRSAQSAMGELARLGITKMNTDKVELLSTVCHAIKETQSTDVQQVRDFMSQWQTNNNQTKAQKFSLEETTKCIAFTIENGLDKKILGGIYIN